MGPVAVILAVLLGLAALGPGAALFNVQGVAQSFGRKPVYAGPRAVGLVQLSSTGKARLIPIVIMMNGKFFDASSYKATPVPMALDFGVVYEAFKTGVSQGMFTITQPGQLNHSWIAEGTWLPVGAKAPETKKKYSPPVIDDDDSKSDRPVLHRRAEGKGDQDDQKPASSSSAPPASTSSSSTSPNSTSGGSAAGTQGADAKNTSNAKSTDAASQPTTSTATKADAKNSTATRTSADDENISDPNRPRLRRGKPDPSAHHELFVDFDAQDAAARKSDGAAAGASTGASTAAKPSSDVPPPVLTVAAVSDAGGPDPRPYTYDLKPAEEAIYRKKMLELAAKFVKSGSGAAQGSGRQGAAGGSKAASSAAGKSASTHASKPANAQFEDVNLRIFDLSNSNEPVLVLSARTALPQIGAPGGHVPQEITLVARTDLEGEVQKLFFAQTDSRHLDVSPRMELIDAVDADGDGRGELLFRRTSDAGSAYAIYRVSADQLWPLWEGTP